MTPRQRFVATALGVLAGIVAAAGAMAVVTAAFTLSFDALRDIAAAAYIRPRLAWLYPVAVDGAMAVAAVAAVVLRNRGRSNWYPWTVVVAGAAISIVANALHAYVAGGALALPAEWAMAVSAVPPLLLALSLHLLIVLAEAVRAPRPAGPGAPGGPLVRDGARSGAGPGAPGGPLVRDGARSGAGPGGPGAPGGPLVRDGARSRAGPGGPGAPGGRGWTIDDASRAYHEALTSGAPLSTRDLASRAGCSKSTATRWIKSFRAVELSAVQPATTPSDVRNTSSTNENGHHPAQSTAAIHTVSDQTPSHHSLERPYEHASGSGQDQDSTHAHT